MRNIKQINMKNRTYYFFNDMIDIKDSDSSLLKIDTKSCKSFVIYNIGYITIKKTNDYENIYSLNPLYLMTGEAGKFIEEKNGSKYLVFDLVDENKEISTKYNEPWDGIKNETETINAGKKCEYSKDFMKIKFDSDDDLPLNRPLNLHMLAIIFRSVFKDEGKLYGQVYLDECLYEI